MIRRNWKNILAWGSVGLNILLIAMILIGPHRLLPFAPPVPKPSPERMLKHMGKDLSKADKVIFDQTLEKYRASFRYHHQDMDRAFADIRRAVAQEPFDAQRVRQAHSVLSRNRSYIDDTIEEFVIEMLTKISPQGRKKLRLGPPPDHKGPPPQ